MKEADGWGLMAVVSWKLGVSAVVDIPTALLSAASLIIVFKYKINTAWIVLAGGITGLLLSLF